MSDDEEEFPSFPQPFMSDDEEESPSFPQPFMYENNSDNDECKHPFTLMEIAMMGMSGKIRSKKDWVDKYKNPEIVEKWKKEGKDQGLSEIQMKYILDQLQFYEKIKKNNMEPAFIHEIWQSNNLIPAEMRDEFLKIVSKFEENIPEENKDWHPGSDDKVLNLIHPSLYCCVYNKSKKISMKRGIPHAEIMKPPVCDETYSNLVSDKYQWLPSNFSVDPNGLVEIESYINNLHPDNEDMYKIIEKIFEKFVPMFNEALTSFNMNLSPPVPKEIDWYGERKPKSKLKSRGREEYDDDDDAVAKKILKVDSEAESRKESDDDDGDDESDDDDDNNFIKSFKTHKFIPIEPGPFKMPDFDSYIKAKDIIDLKDTDLQVIVKISSIELTPEKPKYDGGVWHLEGMYNEHIIATGIYYYAIDNITESKLLFRQAVNPHFYYIQNDLKGLEKVYGLVDRQSLNQYIGNVVAEEGKCIVFPNVYQHQVAPFELVDKTKPGTRKILAFFLVDPSEEVTSTADILPQQEYWLEPTVKAFKLFPNVDLKVLKDLVYTMSLDEAKNHRLQLMDERKAYNSSEACQFVREFSCCEH